VRVLTSLVATRDFWHHRGMRALFPLSMALGVVACFVALGMATTSCTSGNTCACAACGNAVTLNVFSRDNHTPLTGAWSVDAAVNGQNVDLAGACDAVTRGSASNTCQLGTELGVYDLVIRAQGFADREVAVRVAQGLEDCCSTCISPQSIDVELTPNPAP
jgi:hypothetical protein